MTYGEVNYYSHYLSVSLIQKKLASGGHDENVKNQHIFTAQKYFCQFGEETESKTTGKKICYCGFTGNKLTYLAQKLVTVFMANSGALYLPKKKLSSF